MLRWLRRKLASDEQIEDGACNKYGHDWRHVDVHGYYTHNVPHFGWGNSFKVQRKDYYKCRKCGKPDFRKTRIGRIKVDKDTDELTVVQ